MKKIIALIILSISTHNIIFSMDLPRKLSPKNRQLQKYIVPESIIIKEINKTTTPSNLLLLVDRAKKDHHFTPSHIARFALEQKKYENSHDRVFIQMTRIANYIETIEGKNKLCPVIHLHNNFHTNMLLYREYREVRLRANQCGLSISKLQQQQATPYPIKIDPNIAFEDYINLEIDLYQLDMNPSDWRKIVTMLTAQSTNESSSFIPLDNNNF